MNSVQSPNRITKGFKVFCVVYWSLFAFAEMALLVIAKIEIYSCSFDTPCAKSWPQSILPYCFGLVVGAIILFIAVRKLWIKRRQNEVR